MQFRRFSCQIMPTIALGILVCAPPVLIADVVILKSGTKIECEVIGYQAGKLSLRKPDGKIIAGDIRQVSEILFAPAQAVTPVPPPPVATETNAAAATGTNEPPVAVVAPPPPRVVHEYKTVSEILRALPSELQPHKEAWKKNPLMRTKMARWFDENAVGSKLLLPPREVLGIDTEGWLTIELRDFSVGTVKYKCDSGIRCQYWAAIPVDATKYLKLLNDLKAEGKSLTDYYAEKNKEKAVISARLSKLKIGKRDDKGRSIKRGTRVGVSGTIHKFDVMTFMDAKPPFVRVEVELTEAVIED